MIDVMDARAEWAARVARQSEQMLIIAAATNDDELRDELLDHAERLSEQSARIRSTAC